MYDSLLYSAPYLLLLLAACCSPKSRKRWQVIVLAAINFAGSLPWVFAEMAGSNAKWPRAVSGVVTIVTILVAVLLLRRQKKQEDSEPM